MNFLKKISSEGRILGILYIIFILIFLFLAPRIETQWCQDSHWYMSLAKSFATGKGYKFYGTNFPHSQYPPGMAILASPFYWIIGDIFVSGIIVAFLFSLLSIFLVYKIGSLIGKKEGLLAAAFLIFHNLFVFYSASFMTEIPFMFFSLASIHFFIKGFEKEGNEKFFFLSFLFFAISSLIRYDGLLLVLVFGLYSYRRRDKIKDLNIGWISLGILSVFLLLGGWFLRNWIVFGNPLYTSYFGYENKFTIAAALSFLYKFFNLGYLFPPLVLLGAHYALKKKNKEIQLFLFWMIIYILLHMYWWGRPLRFYVEILGFLCILSSLAVFGLAESFKLNKKKTKIFIIAVLITFILSQVYIFFYAPKGESGWITINRYNSIRDISYWANENLPDNAFYAVPDYAVYSLYLKKPNIVGYNQGINLLARNNTVFILTDNLHLWITSKFLKGKEGEIVLPIGNGKILKIETETLFDSTYKGKEAMVFSPKKLLIGNIA